MDINGGEIRKNFGFVSFSFDDEEVSIFNIYVYKNQRRKGNGSKLLGLIEKTARMNRIRRIMVPVTPSKQALSFWISLGYATVFPEENALINDILKDNDACKIIDSNSGVILMAKTIE